MTANKKATGRKAGARKKRKAAKKKPGTKRPVEILTVDELQRLAAAPSRRAPTGVRNRALILLLATSGLRIAEALALKPSDYDAEAGTVRVLRGKGSKARTAPVDKTVAADAIEKWVQVRKELGVNGRQRLFCTLQGGPMKTAYLRQLLPRLAAKAEIEKRVHAHGLRHFCAATMMRNGASVHDVQTVLGHASLAVTAEYLRGIAPIESIRSAQAIFADLLAPNE